ncbi:electron transfer flavoprotein subunit alpha/FixB family protein [Clostridium sp. DL1XJH146]
MNNLKIENKWEGILVYVEYNENGIHPITYELIGKALELAKPLDYKVYCVFIGYNIKTQAEKLRLYDIEKVFIYDHKEFEYYREDIYSNAFEACIDKLKPSIVLIGGTDRGKSIAPSLATRFKTGLTADCTDLLMDEKADLIQIRPAFGGNVMAKIVTENHRPQFATVRYKVMDEAKELDEARDNLVYCFLEEEEMKSKIEIIDIQDIDRKENITEEKVLVVVGQGFKSKEDISMAEELASLLNGKLASSRTLVEKGWMPYEKQIGLSGNTVKPDMIITLGVSGSVQFMAGMRGSKNIIAINIDKEAPIFQIAHNPICGDLYEIVPTLIEKLKLKLKLKEMHNAQCTMHN